MLEFTINAKKSDNIMYHFIPLEVPEGIGRLEFYYDFYPEKVKGEMWVNEVGICLKDLNGVDVGARGRKGEKIVVSGAYSTIGYDRREIEPGTWTLVITANRFISDEYTIKVYVDMIAKKEGWYAGDTHCHTSLSDGHCTYQQVLKKAERNGLDYLIMTDHNRTVMGNLPLSDKVTMIEGVEMTYPCAHANIWGVKEPYSKGYATNHFEEWLEMKKECEANGALVSINHPQCSKCGWLWPLDGQDFYDSIEVWNGPMRPDNQKCIDWWHQKLCEGKKLKIVGGSDFHYDILVTNFIGNPTTWVYAKSNSPKDILEGIKAGHTTISERTKSGTMITMSAGEAICGDTVKYTEGQTVKVSVKRFKRGDRLLVKNDDGVIFEKKCKRSGDYEFEVVVPKAGFVRAETKKNYNPIMKFVLNIALVLMVPKQAFKPHPEYCTALCAPIYFE